MNFKMTVVPRVLIYMTCLFLVSSCSDPFADLPEKRLMILGVDGMDYRMTQRLMDEGKMPNFSRLSQQGVFMSLGTSVPPLSPVAWSDFMTGMDSGGHGIFDFLHRDPHSMLPEFSMSKVIPPEDHISLGSWHIPIDSGQLVNLRKGDVFWKELEAHGIKSTIMRMPANFPPVGEGERELSGMGTPDIHGGYGRFTFISSRFGAGRKKIDGGEIQETWLEKGVYKAVLNGPLNPLKDPELEAVMQLPIIITPASKNSIVIDLDGEEIKLASKQWSDWIPVEFTMMPVFSDLHGMVRFYLRGISPNLELYISPINFDPLNADTALSVPVDFVEDLAEETGRFYTQGMPEDTKALESGVLNLEEFFTQANLAAQDIMKQMDLQVKYLLEQRRGFLFYYLGHLDQISHMTWKSTDPEHPAYDPKTDPYWANKLEQLYIDIDEHVGHLVEQLKDKSTLIVMSDHGFAPWRREMDLNAWLHKNGYLVLNQNKNVSREGFLDVDWEKTIAYGVGFNGLYLNLKGRESSGILKTAEKADMLTEIGDKLLATIDPGTNKPAITKIYRTESYYEINESGDRQPDMIIGYAYGTRGSSSSALGSVSNKAEVFKDHLDPWSGDHSMDHETVPGVFLSSGKVKTIPRSIKDMQDTILDEFDLKVKELPAPK